MITLNFDLNDLCNATARTLSHVVGRPGLIFGRDVDIFFMAMGVLGMSPQQDMFINVSV